MNQTYSMVALSPQPNVVPEKCIDGHLLPWDALPQHVMGEGGKAEEGLQDGIHVASVAKVGESEMIYITSEKEKNYTRTSHINLGPGIRDA